MTYIVYLVLFISMSPGPTYVVLDDFKTMQQCQDAASTFIRKSGLTPEQGAKLACTPVITSLLTDPV